MGKGEIARYEQFLLFPQCFQKACFPGASKGVIVWEWDKLLINISSWYLPIIKQSCVFSFSLKLLKNFWGWICWCLKNGLSSWILNNLCFVDRIIVPTPPFNPLPNNKFRTLPNWHSLQTTILSLMKMAESSQKVQKTLWEMEKLLVTSNFSFSQCFQKTLSADT